MSVESILRARRWLPWLLLATPAVHAQNADQMTPLEPFRIVGNLYYVGSKDLASYLIVTRQGDILINSNFEKSVPQITGLCSCFAFMGWFSKLFA